MVQGERLLGRFTVGERIGGGGHGTVHRAWDERLCRWVAVKSVEGQPADRVLREAHAAARLNHPGIVTLYELGHQNGCAYLVSELVDGSNLRELAARGELSDRDVAELGAEICAALAHAHAAGVIHRDLKPDNVLVRRRNGSGRFSRGSGERALLADFGIATVADAPTLTQTGQVVGTLSYMSPEQAMGEGAGEPSDVYSLALTLYELWAGFNPVSRATPAATARAIGEPVASLGWERPELPERSAPRSTPAYPEPRDRPGLGDLQEALASMRGALHPDRAVPELAHSVSYSTGRARRDRRRHRQGTQGQDADASHVLRGGPRRRTLDHRHSSDDLAVRTQPRRRAATSGELAVEVPTALWRRASFLVTGRSVVGSSSLSGGRRSEALSNIWTRLASGG